MLALVGQVAQELQLHGDAVHDAAPAPTVLRFAGLERDALERPLDAAEVGVGFDVSDEEHVDVGRSEVRGDEAVVSGEDLGHEAAEHDEGRVLVAQLVRESDERELCACSRLA